MQLPLLASPQIVSEDPQAGSVYSPDSWMEDTASCSERCPRSLSLVDHPFSSATVSGGVEDLLPLEILELVMRHLKSPKDLLSASLVCRRWNFAATSPRVWESISNRSMSFAYSHEAISLAYHGDWKRFFMDNRRLHTSLLLVVPNVTASSLYSGGLFRDQFQLDGLGWTVVLLVRSMQPAGQLVSLTLLPSANSGVVSVAFTVRVLSSSGSTISRAQHVFLEDQPPLEILLPLNSAQLSDPTREFLRGDRLRVAVHVETLEQRTVRLNQELQASMDKWVACGFSAERVMEALQTSSRSEYISESLSRLPLTSPLS